MQVPNSSRQIQAAKGQGYCRYVNFFQDTSGIAIDPESSFFDPPD